MTHIGHLFDDTAGWEQRVGVSQLLDRWPGDRYDVSLASIAPATRRLLQPTGRRIDVLPRLTGAAFLSAPAVSRFVTVKGVDLIHAWGVPAAAAARALPDVPLVIHLFHPRIAQRQAKRLRAMARPNGFAVACSSETVRRRLVEGGLPRDRTVVIRPGVDFALINRCRRGDLRQQLGVAPGDCLVVVPEPRTHDIGQFEAIYAAAMTGHLAGRIRIIVPGRSRAKRRIDHLISSLPVRPVLVSAQSDRPFEQLIAISDVLLVTPISDISTTSIAWAMASGAAVIATAVYSIAELIAHKVNGLLFKQEQGRSIIPTVHRLLKDRVSQDKAREVARGQAYEVFGLRRYTDQTLRLYDNLINDAPPEDGIADSAIDT